jgi:hypothetical protein
MQEVIGSTPIFSTTESRRFAAFFVASMTAVKEIGLIFLLFIVANLIAYLVPRPWMGAYWVMPLPNTRGATWVNFNSPFLYVLGIFSILYALRWLAHLLLRRRKSSKNAP